MCKFIPHKEYFAIDTKGGIACWKMLWTRKPFFKKIVNQNLLQYYCEIEFTKLLNLPQQKVSMGI